MTFHTSAVVLSKDDFGIVEIALIQFLKTFLFERQYSSINIELIVSTPFGHSSLVGRAKHRNKTFNWNGSEHH